MAEFKLGRIRFIWKGAWTTGTNYVRDDIVQYGGKTFICILAHTASNQLDVDLNDIQPKWEQFGDGVSWESDWSVSTYYKVNDIVKNGGYLYVCNEGHESAATPDEGLEADISKWDLFAEGISYQEIWSVGTKYRVNDIVKYGASTYICTTAHTAAATVADGLEADSDKWDLFSQGIDWKADWNISTRYKLYDVVKYSGKLYICIVGHTSAATDEEGIEVDLINWQLFNEGFNYLNDWTPDGTKYRLNDVVKNGSALYICITAHVSTSLFASDEANWEIFVPGLEFENSWNSSTVYQPGDFVTYGGFSYVAKTNHSNSIPSTNPVDWSLYLTGFNLVGDWDNTTEYKVGDVVRVGGYTYLAILDNVGYIPPNATYWNKLNEGFKWKGTWTDVTEYDLGDVVRYTDFSYICVQTHTSSAGDRPDVDTNGNFWNLMVSGTEENVLTAEGDLLYFGGAGPVRLGIGAPGQILKVNSAGTAPEWAYYGLVDNVYFVAPNGTDLPSPDFGTTSDKPWLTVAYACNQILNATRNSQAKYLLDQNIDFIAAEVVEWTDYQIANDIAPFTNAFTYDKETCRRDMTQIIRHVAYDLSHGGNVETRKAAQSYFTTAGQTYISGQESETIASINYGLDLMVNAVLANTAPAQNYQTLNGVGTPETQTIDLLYTAETGTDTELTNYIGLITTVINDGDTTSLPAEQVVNNTLFIKTGEYAEELPIIVPANTALVGDELRSTRVIPTTGFETSDMFYVRNGCGIRNMTLSGLNGNLTSPPEGTSRPTAGAYVSLDPGTGPEDRLAWIHNKSTYVQNVSTFGTGCIGLKVDGALHNGGNDSIVANDFTQILSDGIGYWVTNLGRSELVSVFTYYNYIGYLAENGGKIRATNGNNSYGTYGSVAEGIDSTEVPITATVNNRFSEAIIDNTFTDGDRILTIEYLNAGVNYTAATDALKTVTLNDTPDNTRTPGVYTVSGTSNGSGVGQEFEITVQETGVILYNIEKEGALHAPGDIITISSGDIGGTGTGFTFTINTIGNANNWSVIGEGINAEIGQSVVRNGGITQIKMLNTNDEFGGAGYLFASNNAQSGTSTQITIANTDGAPTGAYNGMAIFIQSGVGAGQYGYIDTFNAGSKIATVKRVSDDTPGWDHLVPGTAIEVALDQTSNYSIEPRVVIPPPASGITAFARAKVVSEQIYQINIIEPGSGYDPLTPPAIGIIDPNNTVDAPISCVVGDGVLAQPNWGDRGEGYDGATISVSGDGFADLAQNGEFVFVQGLTDIPQNGSNIQFIDTPGISDNYYKLVRTAELTGTPGNYKIRLQISPEIPVDLEPEHGDSIEFRIRYSQVRLTGHDFLDIGTGNFVDTNYPGLPNYQPEPQNETVESGGGRVFYTSTDQDGNFRVGELFTVEQATGVATIDADNFSLSGLQELQLGSVGLGGTGAIINEFSTDGTFAANSDSIVPTQRAIRTFINSQIGGGLSTLNVNTLISGTVQIDSNRITTTTGDPLNIEAPMDFKKGVVGIPLALQYFLT